MGRPSAELATECDKHHIDEAIRDILGFGLNGIEYGGAGVDAVRTGKEELKHPVFARRERKPAAVQGHDMGFRRKDESITGERSGGASLGRAQNGADSRQQDRTRERLGDVVVRSEVETPDDIPLLALRGQHNDRNIPNRGIGADAAADLVAVHARKHDIEKNKIGSGGQHRGKARFTVRGK